MIKWPLRFGGGPRDLPVDEFVFRAETLARLANLSQPAMALGLHQILTGNAATWYWIFIRNHPDATWPHVRQALIEAFQSNVSDDAIRRLINDRLQRPNERFMDFCIAMQELEVRLTQRMTDAELLQTLRRNMLPHVQDRLLFMPINSVLELQRRCHQVEELAQRQSEVQQIRRGQVRISELEASFARSNANPAEPWAPSQGLALPPATDFPPSSVPYFPSQTSTPGQSQQSAVPEASGHTRSAVNLFRNEPVALHSTVEDAQQEWVSALDDRVDRNQFTICWNCDDIGHAFMDCTATRNVFCYGCGAKNTYRSQCPKCSLMALQGNGRRNGRPGGPTRAGPAQVGPSFRIAERPPRPQ